MLLNRIRNLREDITEIYAGHVTRRKSSSSSSKPAPKPAPKPKKKKEGFFKRLKKDWDRLGTGK